ncbi:MAG TPA: hypothetical protein V6D10_22880 [Trichocoleus sp.]|jgi:hypothetical protein
MVRNIEQIAHEMTVLEKAIDKIAQEFHHAYSQYLMTLGQAIRQQLILASYHLCTHGYPDQFLKLSLSQRQELQQAIRQLAKEAQAQTSEPLQSIVPMLLMPSRPFFGVEEDETDSDFDEATSLEDLFEEEEAKQQEQNTIRSPEAADLGAETPASETMPLTPKDILNWQEMLEDSLLISLQTLSHAANRILQRSGLLPKQLPEPVLEVAAKTELSTEATASPPNLLSLLIETESEESKESTMTQVMAIRLRLSEIEYADVSLSVSRSRIRELSAQLSKLGRDYYKKRRELSTAQAEAAWRASWYEG